MQNDRVLINGLPLPDVFVLPIGATFKIIESSTQRCECGPVHKSGCRVVAADDADESLAPFGYVVDRQALDAIAAQQHPDRLRRAHHF